MAGRGGLEPPLRGPEPRVLPLDDLPTWLRFYAALRGTVKAPSGASRRDTMSRDKTGHPTATPRPGAIERAVPRVDAGRRGPIARRDARPASARSPFERGDRSPVTRDTCGT